jgi:hypothetical protein
MFVALSMFRTWRVASDLSVLLMVGFNILMYLTRAGNWVITSDDERVFVRAVARPLILTRTKDALNRLSIVVCALSQIRSLSGHRIEIVTESGNIYSHWLVFEVEPEVLNELETRLSRFYAERVSMHRPVEVLLRTDEGKYFLRWDGVKPPLNEFLAAVSSRYPGLSGTAQIGEHTVDAKDLISQPEIERRAKIRFLINLGMVPFAVSLLTTARNGMSLMEASNYVGSIRGNAR